ncbi:type II toxin-antitoxin system CcdA family antitoxin [Bosea sp. NPDC055332]
MNRIPKRSITLLRDPDLIEVACAHGLNLSAITENALRKQMTKEDARRWLAENSEAITAQNAWTAEHCLFSDEFRGR